MEEAEYLCGRVAIMDHGKIVALDTAHSLIESSGMEERIIFEGDVPNIEELKNVKGVLNVQENQGEVTVYGKGADLLQNVVSYLQVKGINYRNLQTKTPNLEDAFLKLTGRTYEGDTA
jgi:ABC-2 type transport system ATP-binding protein